MTSRKAIVTITINQVAARMNKVADATKTGSRTTVEAAASKAKAIIAEGAPGRLRNAGRNGANLGIRYQIQGAGTDVSARLHATGPWPLIESDTPAHTIRPKKRRGGRRSGRGGGVSVPGVGVFRLVHHPGTKGKHPWAKGVAQASPVVAREMSKKMANIGAAAFGG